MEKVIIIGASTGIGRSLAELYAQKGYEIAITGRRVALLEELKNQFPQAIIHTAYMDTAEVETSLQTMQHLAQEMKGFDVVVINAGVGFPKATFAQEMATVDINVKGFWGLACWSYEYFKQQGHGHLVGISSLAGIRSSPHAPEYHASKAFVSSYLEGLRMRSRRWNPTIYVTDIRPGFVDTPMTKTNTGMFWVAPPEKAAQQIYEAIEAKVGIAYITKRYRLISWIQKIVPEWLLAKI